MRAAVLVALAAGVALTAHAQTLRLSGTGSGVGTMALLVDAFAQRPGGQAIQVLPALGSSGGLKALRAGQLQLAVTNRDVTADESAAGLQCRRYGSSPLALVTHAGVPATAMTRERLADLLAGRELRWPGGQAVRLVLRPASDGDSQLLARLSPAVDAALALARQRPGMVLAQTDSEAADYIERTSNAMGALALAQIRSEQRKLSVLSLDGVAASPAMVEAGRYPMAKDMFLCLRGDAAAAVKAFADFVHSSPDASAILRRTGHVGR